MKTHAKDQALAILNGHLASGTIVILDDLVLGQASNSETVELGHVPSSPKAARDFGLDALYRYLIAHPTSDTW